MLNWVVSNHVQHDSTEQRSCEPHRITGLIGKKIPPKTKVSRGIDYFSAQVNYLFVLNVPYSTSGL